MVKINPKLLLEAIYPVGSIFINTTGTNPSTFLGGTWEEFGKGRVLVGKDTTQTEFDTLGETGGEKTHKLTIAEMPKHRHGFYYAAQNGNDWGINLNWNATAPGGRSGGGTGQGIDYEGGDGYHNNLQPYIVVSMWQRTA